MGFLFLTNSLKKLRELPTPNGVLTHLSVFVQKAWVCVKSSLFPL